MSSFFSRILPFAVFLAGVTFSCSAPEKKDTSGEEWFSLENRYAEGFRIDTAEGLWRTTVLHPWQGKDQKVFSYFLAKGRERAAADAPLLRIPVQRVIVTSTTHVAFLKVLGKSNTIAGISGTDFVYDPEVRARIAAGKIKEIGHDESMDYELILHLQPDVIFLYGIGPSTLEQVTRLTRLGIPAVVVGDYLEHTPLGRAEWLRFFGAFFDEEPSARHYLDSLAERYEGHCLPDTLSSRPLILTGLPWNETWYVPGGRSLTATLIHDAGGRYVWEDLPTADAYPMDIEKVFHRGGHADIWINCGSATSLRGILRVDDRLALFRPFREKRIYNNDRRMSPGGGNDYWEGGVVHPDMLLDDLRQIFHPVTMPAGRSLVYYRQIE